jgi:hypothetical protein
MELNTIDCIFPCCMYRQSFTVRLKSDRTDQFLQHCTRSCRQHTDCPNPRIARSQSKQVSLLDKDKTRQHCMGAGTRIHNLHAPDQHIVPVPEDVKVLPAQPSSCCCQKLYLRLQRQRMKGIADKEIIISSKALKHKHFIV